MQYSECTTLLLSKFSGLATDGMNSPSFLHLSPISRTSPQVTEAWVKTTHQKYSYTLFVPVRRRRENSSKVCLLTHMLSPPSTGMCWNPSKGLTCWFSSDSAVAFLAVWISRRTWMFIVLIYQLLLKTTEPLRITTVQMNSSCQFEYDKLVSVEILCNSRKKRRHVGLSYRQTSDVKMLAV